MVLLNYNGEHNSNTLKIIEKLIHTWKSNKDFELEAKHVFVKVTNAQGASFFKNGTTLKNANFLIKTFQQIKEDSRNVYEEIDSEDKFYVEKNKKPKTQAYRKTTFKNGETEILMKIRIENIDVNYWFDGYHFSNIRFSLAREIKIDKLPEKELQNIMTRVKHRKSLTSEDIFKYELTEIKNQGKKFEFEIELARNKKSESIPSARLAEMLLSKVVESFENKPRIRATFSQASNNLFKMKTANFLIRKNQKNDNYNLFCLLDRDSNKTIKVISSGADLNSKYEEILNLHSNIKSIVGKFYYNILNGQWELIGIAPNNKIASLSEFFESLEKRVGY